MANKRFNVMTAAVNEFGNEHVGWYVRDEFTGYPVGDGKGGIILVYGDRIMEAQKVCAEMNERTAGTAVEDSAVHVPTDEELGLAA